MLFFLIFTFLNAQGPSVIQSCTACHGSNGIGVSPLWPNLAGQKKDYLILQLNAFKSGARANEIMTPISQTLSEQDIQQLAEYYSSLKP